MQKWLKTLLVVVGAILVVYLAFVGFTYYNNGHDVEATLTLGTSGDGMYIRCGSVVGATCTGGDQAILTVGARDRVHLKIHNADGGDHSHDFNLQGWQYAIPPVSPEMELHEVDQDWTFTAWASGSYHMLCEITDHEARGMRGTFVVKG